MADEPSRFFQVPGSPRPSAPAPAAETPPPDGPASMRAALFQEPAAPAPKEEPGGETFDVPSFVRAEVGKLLPETFLKPGDPNAKEFPAVREALAKVTERAVSAEMRLARAHTAGKSVAEEALRSKLAEAERELSEFKPRLEKMTVLEARAELADNDAFMAPVEKISSLKAEALEIGKDAGVDAETIEKAFAATTKLGIVKALGDIEDADVKQLIREVATQALESGNKFRSDWKDPIKALGEWREKARELGEGRSLLNGETAVQLHRRAIEVLKSGDETRGLKPNWALEHLDPAVLSKIESQYVGNLPVKASQVVEDRIQAATVPHLLGYASRLEELLSEANLKLKKLGALTTTYAAPGQQSGATVPVRKTLWGELPVRVGPLIPQAEPATTPQRAGGMMIPGATRG